MANKNRWLLPEGVEEILPRQAWQIEEFRRKVLDLYRSWGYELVIPPLIEYSESLLIGLGSDMDLQSFKVTDQLSGRTLAIRPDITPQVARIDAHSWRQEGPSRLCYAGTVVHTRPKNQLASRTPIEVGAELYGDAGKHSDIEIIGLMLETIKTAGISKVYLDLGHVGIYRSLVLCAGLTADAAQALFDAFDRKSKTDINAILSAHVPDAALAGMIRVLVDLNGELEVLDKAREALANAPIAVAKALDYMQSIAQAMVQQFPDVPMYVDLAELRGYQYHTGLVFAAYVEGVGHAVANGGRYDGIGEAFGRSRPATGFSANVKALLTCSPDSEVAPLVLAPPLDDQTLQDYVAALRAQGLRVVRAAQDGSVPSNCTQEVIQKNGHWQLCPLAK